MRMVVLAVMVVGLGGCAGGGAGGAGGGSALAQLLLGQLDIEAIVARVRRGTRAEYDEARRQLCDVPLSQVFELYPRAEQRTALAVLCGMAPPDVEQLNQGARE